MGTAMRHALRAGCLLLVASLVATPAEAATLTHGPLLGALTETSAIVWVRTSAAALVVAESSLRGDFSDAVAGPAIQTSDERDFTAHLPLVDLPAGARITYRVRLDGALVTPPKQFTTVPVTVTAARVPVFSDWARSDTFPGLFTALARDPFLVIFLGDLDHSNPTSLSSMRLMHRQVRGPSSLLGIDISAGLIEAPFQVPVYHVWDDHDMRGDDADRTFGRIPEARRAFREYWPMPNDSGATIDQTIRVGGLVDIFLPDLRSERDPKEWPDTPQKSMLGAAQKERLKAWLLASTAPWKLVPWSVTWNPTAKDNDSWRGYQTEAGELLAFIAAHQISGVLFAGGDLHSGGGLNLDPLSGIPDCAVPRANYCGNQTGKLGIWSHGIDSSVVGPGFCEYTLTPTSATVQVIGADGVIRRTLTVQKP